VGLVGLGLAVAFRLLAGVYWTEDQIIEPATAGRTATEAVNLAAENQRLREEIEQLKNNAG